MIRLATESDAQGILDIYGPIVRSSVISFEYDPPPVTEVRRRITELLPNFPWIVYETDGEILGYVYGGPHGRRTAYQWSTDVSVYIDPSAHRRGIARGLYTALFHLLKCQGYFNLYAGVTLPNRASVGLHESLGFKPLGTYHQVGYKHGQWHDVGWWELELRPRVTDPPTPVPFATLQRDANELQRACAAGLALIRPPRR